MSTPALVPERTSHPFLTYDMIKDIPKGLKLTIQTISSFKEVFPESSRLIFTGNGTAFYSSWMGSQVLNLTSRDWAAIGGLELGNYEPMRKSAVVVGVSHSGITKATVDALAKWKSFGARTIGITHFQDRPISKIVDRTFVIGDSPDKSRCHTKAYTNSAAAVFSLALAQSSGSELQDIRSELETSLADEVSSTISQTEASAKEAASDLRNVSKIFFAGAGPNVVTAREAALKIKEASYLAAEGMELEEILHGPAMSFNEETLVVVIAPSGLSVERARDLVNASKRIGAKTMVVSDLSNWGADYEIRVQKTHEYLSPFLTVIPPYLFSYYFALENGKNPDYIHYTDQTYWDARTIIFPPGTH